METLASKFFSFLFLTMFGGGWTAPLGLPPAKEDPVLARAAPQKCLFYASWSGTAPADAKSANQTEQLLAEPEVERSFAALAPFMSDTVLPELTGGNAFGLAVAAPAVAVPSERSLAERIDQDRDAAALRRIGMDFARIAATHPGAVFVSDVKTDERGTLVNIRGGAIVLAGQDADKLRAVVERFYKRAKAAKPAPRVTGVLAVPGATVPTAIHDESPAVTEVQIAGHAWYRFTHPAANEPVICGFQGSDFILGVGDGSIEEILARPQHEPPAWLVDLRKELPIERVSTVVYLNLKMLLPLGKDLPPGAPMPKTREAMRRLGLDNLSALCSVSGLDGETFTSKLLLSTEGEPRGILRAFSDQPLRSEDLKPIPRDSTLSLVMRFDCQTLVDQVAASLAAGNDEPPNVDAVERFFGAVTKAMQPDFGRELPKALGDTWCFYSSPGEGGLVTAVVAVKDHKAAAAIQLKLVTGALATSLAGEVMKDAGLSDRSTAPLAAFDFAGHRIFSCAAGLPSNYSEFLPALAWCLTERELILAPTPQNIMAYLQRGQGQKSLAAVPQVGRLLADRSGPSMVAHIDTLRVFELVYPLVPLYAQMGADEIGEPGQRLPPDAFPSFPALRRHLVPGTAALRRTKRGLELVSRQPLPGTGLLWTGALIATNSQSLEQEIANEEKSRAQRSYGVAVPTAPYAGPAVPAPPPSPAAEPAAQPPIYAPADAAPPATNAPAAVPAPTADTLSQSGGPVPYIAPATGGPAAVPALPDAYRAFVETDADKRLRGIGRAIKAYRTKRDAMPPAYLADKQGKPLLSWRVVILPYMGKEELYKRFHLDEPWDSPHNRPLIALMPESYREPLVDHGEPTFSTAQPAKATANDAVGKTQFLLLRGPKTFYADAAPPIPRAYEDWMKAIVVTVASPRAVLWSKPEDFTYNSKDPAAGLSEDFGGSLLLAGSALSSCHPAFPMGKSELDRLRRDLLLEAFTGEEQPRLVPADPRVPFTTPTLPPR